MNFRWTTATVARVEGVIRAEQKHPIYIANPNSVVFVIDVQWSLTGEIDRVKKVFWFIMKVRTITRQMKAEP